jgi:hypothetical protein
MEPLAWELACGIKAARHWFLQSEINATLDDNLKYFSSSDASCELIVLHYNVEFLVAYKFGDSQ